MLGKYGSLNLGSTNYREVCFQLFWRIQDVTHCLVAKINLTKWQVHISAKKNSSCVAVGMCTELRHVL